MHPLQHLAIACTSIFLLKDGNKVAFSQVFLIPVPDLWTDHDDIVQPRSQVATCHPMPPREIVSVYNHVVAIVAKRHHLVFLPFQRPMQQNPERSQAKFFGQHQVRCIVIQLFPITPTERPSQKTEQFLEVKRSELETGIDFLIVERLVA